MHSFSSAAFYDGLGSFDDSEAGTTIFPILKRNPEARALALGGNLGAMENGPSVAWWNPAGLADVNGYWTNFTHASLYGEGYQEFVTTTLPLAEGRTLAFTANGLWTGDVDNARDIDESSSTYSATEFMVGASLGWELIPRVFSAGASFYYLNSLLADVNTQTVSADLGLRWNLKWDMVNSFSIHNLSPGARSNRPGQAPLERLPLTVRWSIGVPMGPDMVDLYGWNLGLTKTNDGLFSLSAGWEQKVQNFVFLRAGREVSLTSQEQGIWGGTSGGVGLQVNTLRFDYGFRYNGFLGAEHLVGIKFALFEKPARERLPLIDQARAWYAEGDCYKASLLAHAVKEKSPMSIEAAAILQNCQIKKEIQSEDYISIIYSNHIRGQIFDLTRGEVLYGGFSRRMTLLNQLRKENPLSLTIDAGHWAAPIRHWERDSLLIGSLKKMNYDAILWDSKVAQTPSVVNGSKMPSQFKPDALNWLGAVDSIPTSKYYEVGGRNVLVMGVSDTNLRAQELNQLIQKEISSWHRSQPKEELHLSALMWPASESKVKEALANGLEIQLLINKNGFIKSENINNTIVVSGSPGEYGLFRFYFDDDQLKNFDHQVYPINSGIEPQQEMVYFLQDSIRASEDILNQWTPKPSPYFVFLNQMDPLSTHKDIYLKDPIKNFDYRINHRAQNFFSPDLSPSRQRVAFIEELKDSSENSRVVSVMNTVDKRRISISLPDIQVHKVKWDPFENWIFYHYSDIKGRQGLMRVRPSGLESKMFFEQDQGFLKDFNFSSDARFVASHWQKSEFSWVEHWSLRSKSKVRVTADSLYAYQPEYSPNGLYLAYLAESLQENPQMRGADLWLYDVNTGKTQRVTRGARIQDIEWSVSGDHLVFAEGDLVQDLNFVHIATQRTSKLNPRVELQSEENPKAYKHLGQEGFLYEKVYEGSRQIYWIAESGGESILMVDLPGFNTLP